MLNDVVNGISIKLNSVFGDSCEIYTENVEQGLQEPCFFIKTLPTRNQSFLGKRKKRTYSFDIAYFPKEGNEEMMLISEQTLDALEYITLLNGDMLRGVSLEAEIVDDVLHVSVNYNVILNEITTGDPMEVLTSDIGTKG